MCLAVMVADAAGAREAMGLPVTIAEGSVTTRLVRVTLPVLVMEML